MIKKIKLTITSILFFMLCLNSFAQVTPGSDSNGKFYDVVIDGPDANLTVNFSITRALDEHNTGVQTGTKRRGRVNISPSGGTPPYSYNLYKVGTTAPVRTGTISTGNKEEDNLLPGSYFVEVYDKYYSGAKPAVGTGCNHKKSVTRTLINPKLLKIRGSITTSITCFNGQGTITAYVQGGIGNYRVQLIQGSSITEKSATNAAPPSERPVVFGGLGDGIYTLKVIDSKNVVKQTASIRLNQPPLFVLNGSSVNVTKNVTCNAGSDGVIRIQPSGGTKPYRVVVRKGSSTIVNTTYNSNTITIGSLSEGNYNITVNDIHNCSLKTFTRIVTQPDALSITATPRSTKGVGNNDGEVDFEIEGGTPNTAGYTFTFEGANLASPNPRTGSIVADASGNYKKTFTGLKKGTYKLTIVDNTGVCTTNRTISIIDPAPLVINSVNSTNVDCNGEATGTISVTASGGFQPTYRFELFKKNETTPFKTENTNPSVTTYTFTSDIRAGEYRVKVSVIVAGSVVETEERASIIITENPIMQLGTPGITDAKCKGGNGGITFPVSGGVGPYTYQWRKKGSSTVLSTSRDFTGNNAKAGIYNLTVTDSKSCSIISSDTEIEEPTNALLVTNNGAPVNLTINIQDLPIGVQPDGKIRMNVSGGWGNYRYKWTDESNNVVGSNKDLIDVKAGKYTLEVTDRSGTGCKIIKDFMLEEPARLEINISLSPFGELNCFGDVDGSLTVEIKGATPSKYSYSWYEKNADGSLNFKASNQLTVSDLESGDYGVEVEMTNNNNVVVKKYPVNDFLLRAPDPITINSLNTRENKIECFGETGSIQIEVKGGTGTYRYFYKKDGGAESAKIPFTSGKSTLIPNLLEGNYEVKILDQNNCSPKETDGTEKILNFTLTEPTKLAFDNANSSASDATGFGVSDGSISVTAKDGTPFTNASGSYYEYSLVEKGSTTVLGTTSTVTGLAGSETGIIYVMTIKDANGCTETKEYTIKQPEQLLVSFSPNPSFIRCNGEKGIINASANGGVPFIDASGKPYYEYQWYNTNDLATVVETSEVLTDVAGTYKLIVTDVNGNVAITKDASGAVIPSEAELKENPVVEVIFTKQDVKCKGDATGSILLDVKGGTGVYTYRWSHDNSLNTNDISGLTVGKYTVRVTDENGCFDPSKEILEIEILEPTTTISIDSSADIIVDATGFGISDGSISITAKGGTPFTNASGSYYEYSLVEKGSTAVLGTTSTVTGLAGSVSGITYVMTVKDANDCAISKEYLVKEPSELQVELSVTTTIDCNGGDGILSSTVTGGFLKTRESYNYEWFNTNDLVTVVGTSPSLTAKAGTYKLIVTDSNGNVALTRNASGAVIPSEIELKENPVVEVTFTKQDVKCKGDATGSILLDVKGGTGVYTYRWSHNSSLNTNDISGLTVGKYTVRVTDENGCFDPSKEILEIEILEPTTTISIDSSADIIVDATGFGVSDGSISITAQGGTPFTNASGSYYEYSLVEKGSTTVLGTTSTVTGLAGSVSGITYVMTVKDANDCTISKEYLVKEPSELQVELSVTTTIDCNGGDGTLSSTVTGGFLKTGESYNYEWFNTNDLTTVVSTSSTLTAKAGTYKLVVTDSNGNVALTRDASGAIIPSEIELKENLPLTIRYNPTVDVTNVTCYNGADGSINITVEGGTGAGTYIYDWSNGDKTEDLTSLVAGDYRIDITDANNCRTSALITVTQPDLYKIETVLFKTPTGAGLSDGSIRVNVLGGTQPYSSYSWKDSKGLEISTTKEITGVRAGKYIFTVKDSRGCELSTEFNLDQPDPLLISIQEIGSIQCNADTSGVLELVTSGGVGGNTYTWYNATTNINIGSGTRITGQGAGSYYVTVKDANDIEKTSSIYTIVEPTAVTVSSSSVNLSCFESADGEISLSAAGGTGLHSYRYRKDGGAYGTWIEFTSNTKLSGLSIGNYEVQIKDGNDCFLVESGLIKVLDFQITQPAILTLSETITEVTGFGLNNGNIDITITGGTKPYTYSWTDASGSSVANTEDISNLTAGVYTLTFQDAQGCALNESFTVNQPDELLISIQEIGSIQCNADTSGVLELVTSGGVGGNVYTWYDASTNVDIGNATGITGQGAGSYYVTVKDTNGNEATSSTYTIVEPTAVTVSSSSVNLSCFESADGEISLSAAGGTGLHSYRYRKDGGAYGTWIEFTSNTKLSGLSIGNYEVQIKDGNDCFLVESGSIKVLDFQITQPAILTLLEAITEVTGFGLSNGSIDITVTGGTQPYTYVWTDSSGSLIANTEDISNLTAGIYTLTFEDAQGCTLNESFTVKQPNLLEVTVQQQAIVFCKGDKTASITSNVTGGMLPYTYEWFEKGNTTVLTTDNTLQNIGTGIYYAIVRDANNNQTQSLDINISEPEILTVDVNPISAGCGTTDDWTIEANVSGGTPPYSYFWNTGERTQKIENKSLGSYFVVITDANGCRTTENIVLENNSPLTVTETVKEIVCYNQCSGEIDLQITGGVAPYTIVWNSGQTTPSVTNLCSGDYTVEVTDQKGCSIVKTIKLVNPEEFIFELVPNEVTLCYEELIEYDVTMNGIAKYSWISDNGFKSNSSVVSLTEGGNYTLTVTTDKGCTVSKELKITKSDVIIDAQLILSSQAFVGEDIAIINVSNPFSANVEWDIPSNVEVVQKEAEGVVLRFVAPGDYDISLVSIEGNCKKKATKTVNVLKQRNLPDVGDVTGPFIKEFEVYSNPNKGQFKVDVELEKEAEISLRLFNLGANSIEVDKRLKGKKEYTIDYNMNVSAGVYVLLLETAKSKRIRKVVIE